MPACFSCQGNLSADDIYCPSCGLQVQCKNHECNSWLKSNAHFCNVCGTPVGAGIAGISSNQAVIPSPAVNKLEYKDKECSLKTEFTNEVGESLGIQIGSILGTRIAAKAAQRQQTYIQTASAVEDSHLSLPEAVPALAQEKRTIPVSAKPLEASPDAESLKQIFRDKGDRFKLNDPRLKAGSKLDYARRLTYVFLLAYEELKGQDQASRSNLNDILNEAGVYDGNTRTWLNAEVLKDSSIAKKRGQNTIFCPQ
ncbi:MAG: zinc ribbon domain-containing protein [Leptolyngbyaceae cyanobacterium RM1_406_9]|nr:zinc ribbon domain-containing protein [Leptolyngbyaceae cyanobacterium RM1_406_9]